MAGVAAGFKPRGRSTDVAAEEAVSGRARRARDQHLRHWGRRLAEERRIGEATARHHSAAPVDTERLAAALLSQLSDKFVDALDSKWDQLEAKLLCSLRSAVPSILLSGASEVSNIACDNEFYGVGVSSSATQTERRHDVNWSAAFSCEDDDACSGSSLCCIGPEKMAKDLEDVDLFEVPEGRLVHPSLYSTGAKVEDKLVHPSLYATGAKVEEKLVHPSFYATGAKVEDRVSDDESDFDETACEVTLYEPEIIDFDADTNAAIVIVQDAAGEDACAEIVREPLITGLADFTASTIHVAQDSFGEDFCAEIVELGRPQEMNAFTEAAIHVFQDKLREVLVEYNKQRHDELAVFSNENHMNHKKTKDPKFVKFEEKSCAWAEIPIEEEFFGDKNMFASGSAPEQQDAAVVETRIHFPNHERQWYEYYYKELKCLRDRLASEGVSSELRKHTWWLYMEVVNQLEDGDAQAKLEALVKLLLNEMGERPK